MIPSGLLLAITAGLGIALLTAWVVFLGSGLRGAVQRRREKRFQRAREVLAAGVCRLALTPAEMGELDRLPIRHRSALMAAFATHLRGAEREWLGGVARELGLVNEGVRLCRSRLWWRRLFGARLLTLVGGGADTVMKLTGDPNPAVRAQAAEWAGANSSPESIRMLVAMLGDPAQACRFTVEDALLRLGDDVVEPLAEHLRSEPDPVAWLGALHVSRAIGDARLLPAILAAATSPDPALRAAACGALGSLGGGDAATCVVERLADPATSVRAAAARALGDLRHWAAAAQLTTLLEDDDWEVRWAAGSALLRLGPPGEVMLRTTLRSGDPFAADMARHALDTGAVVSGSRATA